MAERALAPRLGRLRMTVVLGCRVPVATGFVPRLLGLSFLAREAAGEGLLIPRCTSVHTFGMRFALDVFFIGAAGELLALDLGVPPCRVVSNRAASAILERPSVPPRPSGPSG